MAHFTIAEAPKRWALTLTDALLAVVQYYVKSSLDITLELFREPIRVNVWLLSPLPSPCD